MPETSVHRVVIVGLWLHMDLSMTCLKSVTKWDQQALFSFSHIQKLG